MFILYLSEVLLVADLSEFSVLQLAPLQLSVKSISSKIGISYVVLFH